MVGAMGDSASWAACFVMCSCDVTIGAGIEMGTSGFAGTDAPTGLAKLVGFEILPRLVAVEVADSAAWSAAKS